jgi:hypothetical protein
MIHSIRTKYTNQQKRTSWTKDINHRIERTGSDPPNLTYIHLPKPELHLHSPVQTQISSAFTWPKPNLTYIHLAKPKSHLHLLGRNQTSPTFTWPNPNLTYIHPNKPKSNLNIT